jgi:ankyrin repeat protein
MRLRQGLYVVAVVALTAMVGAAPATSPVADAAMKGNRDQIRTLISQGADVNGAQGDGMSALHWAADRGDAEMTEMLVYAGANTGAVTRIGQYTPLHLASRAGSAATVRVLLKSGATVDAKASVSGATPLHLAASAGNAEVVSALLDAKADPNAKESEWGQTPLMFAAALNRVDAIKVLLARGADANVTSKAVDLQKHIPLDRASNQRFAKVLEGTAGKNGKPSPNQMQSAVQASRELYASGKLPEPEKPAAPAAGAAAAPGGQGQGQGGQQQFFEETPGLSSKGGLTALLHAARQGHLAAARALVDGGANVNTVSAGDGTSPLLMATINGQFDVAMLLLDSGADPNLAAGVNGATPLWSAVNTQWQPRTRFPQPQEMELQKATYLDVMRKLLEKGADPNARLKQHPWYMVYSGCGNRNCGLADTSGSTAFWRAAYSTDLDAMRLLVKFGADPNIPSMAPKQAVRRGPEGGGPGSDGSKQSLTVEIPKLAPIPYGGPGASALHAAAGVEYGEGFAGNAHRHAPDSWLASVKFLVEEMGLDVNARDNDGYTALHHAAARGDNDVILYLVSKGADVTVVARNGQTTADMANGQVQRVSPFPATVALLEKLGSKNNNRCVSC